MGDAALLPIYSADDRWFGDELAESVRRVTRGTYQPVITATTSTPVLGASGYLLGSWQRTGLRITGWIELLISGSGASIVGTSWRLTLPFSADTTLHSTGVLDAATHNVGFARTRSATAAQSMLAAALLADSQNLVFYGPATNTSLGSADFTTTARMHVRFRYQAHPTNFP